VSSGTVLAAPQSAQDSRALRSQTLGMAAGVLPTLGTAAWTPALGPSRAQPASAHLSRVSVGVGLPRGPAACAVLAAHGTGWAAAAPRPEQAAVQRARADVAGPVPAWLGGWSAQALPPGSAVQQRVCRLRARHIPRRGIPHPPRPGPGSSGVTQGQALAQVVAGPTMEAYLSCYEVSPFSVIYSAKIRPGDPHGSSTAHGERSRPELVGPLQPVTGLARPFSTLKAVCV